MDISLLQSRFERLGARLMVREVISRNVAGFTIDIREDKKGEYFDISVPPDFTLEADAIDVRPDMRHLLLMVYQDGRKDKYLCGHDERHWFVAAVPGKSASTVKTAMQALKPDEVRLQESYSKARVKDRMRRKNDVFIRQGEWFFVPAPHIIAGKNFVVRNEPISRGGGSKSHICEFVYRRGGVTVHVSREHPSGITEDEYKDLIDRNPKARNWSWRVMQRDAEVYARGRVTHSDHKTVYLDGWHRVLMNTENQSAARRNVVFLD